ncbi:ABC transporter substrate-binding protein [Pseudofulvibacter geojedonensis]|uniref:ABC transporter substrate-binding protein n=1 Tax=Pseudofulvibacter geojedonensis TaxID=1123758 RepID=A0ABW3HZY3_9FLAO
MLHKLSIILLFIVFISCKKEVSTPEITSNKTHKIELEYATSFEVEKSEDFTKINLKTPWPEADKSFTYLLVDKEKQVPKNIDYDVLVRTPVDKIVVTSTTHIPSLESLDVLDKLVGFPSTNFISSEAARKKIDAGEIKELGKNESINTEVLLNLQPDIVVGFAINGNNKTFNTIQKVGIPVVYNAAWIEKHALGRAEWIKFFGYLFNKEKQANAIFKDIVTNYKNASKLAANATNKPTILGGSMFKDVWNVPYGNSWVAKFIDDANGDYLWKDTKGSGSIALNIESVIEKAQQADIWVTSGGASTKDELLARNQHYKQFKAFQDGNVYLANKKGATGGLLFFELGPNRPDLILKDLIKIFHPELLPHHELYFYQKIQ